MKHAGQSSVSQMNEQGLSRHRRVNEEAAKLRHVYELMPNGRQNLVHKMKASCFEENRVGHAF